MGAEPAGDNFPGVKGAIHQSLRRFRDRLELAEEFSETLQMLEDTQRRASAEANALLEMGTARKRSAFANSNKQKRGYQQSERMKRVEKREMMAKLRSQSTDQYRQSSTSSYRAMEGHAMTIKVEESGHANSGMELRFIRQISAKCHADSTSRKILISRTEAEDGRMRRTREEKAEEEWEEEEQAVCSAGLISPSSRTEEKKSAAEELKSGNSRGDEGNGGCR